MYRIFKRKAWTRNPRWPGGWEPYIGRKTHVAYVDNADEARRICKQHNDARKSKGASFCEFESA
jgi:hypothetical protein